MAAEHKIHLSLPLLLVCACGIAVVVVFGFGRHIFGITLGLTHWQSWELGALTWTALFSVYYFITFPFPNTEGATRFLSVMSLLVLPGFAVLAVVFLVQERETLHELCVLITGLGLLGTDAVLWKYHTGDRKRHYLECMLFADLPVVIALSVLFGYQLSDRDLEYPGVFFSGAVSFQLLASNVIFVLIQGGIMKNIYSQIQQSPS